MCEINVDEIKECRFSPWCKIANDGTKAFLNMNKIALRHSKEVENLRAQVSRLEAELTQWKDKAECLEAGNKALRFVLRADEAELKAANDSTIAVLQEADQKAKSIALLSTENAALKARVERLTEALNNIRGGADDDSQWPVRDLIDAALAEGTEGEKERM